MLTDYPQDFDDTEPTSGLGSILIAAIIIVFLGIGTYIAIVGG